MKNYATTRSFLAALAALMLLAFAGPSWAAVYTVTYAGYGENITYTVDGGPSQTGTLSGLVNGLVSGGDNTVNVGKGTYTLGTSLKLQAGVKLIGAGAGATILDGGSARRVIECTANSANKDDTVLDGFTITNGKAPGSGSQARGGGMRVTSGASPTITNCTFTSNTADDRGGGMDIDSSNPTVTNCTFSDNTAKNSGGVRINNSSSTLTNCTFAGNKADFGGGMAISTNSSPTITNCTFTGNTATYSGGGMRISYGSPTIVNCTLVNNSATGGGTEAYVSSAELKLVNTLVWNAVADDTITNNNGTVALTNCAGPAGINSDNTGTGYVPIASWTPTSSDVTVAGVKHTVYRVEENDALKALIGKGTSSGAPATDQLGATRNDPPDIGAVEHVTLKGLSVTVSGDSALTVGQGQTGSVTLEALVSGDFNDGSRAKLDPSQYTVDWSTASADTDLSSAGLSFNKTMGVLSVAATAPVGIHTVTVKAKATATASGANIAPVTADKIVTVTVVPVYAVTVTSEPSAGGTASADVGEATEGSTVTLSATPNAGYRFKEWQAVAPANLTIKSATSATASFDMPGEAVEVKAVFTASGAPTPGPGPSPDPGPTPDPDPQPDPTGDPGATLKAVGVTTTGGMAEVPLSGTATFELGTWFGEDRKPTTPTSLTVYVDGKARGEVSVTNGRFVLPSIDDDEYELWVVATLPDGTKLKSDKLYVVAGRGTLTATKLTVMPTSAREGDRVTFDLGDWINKRVAVDPSEVRWILDGVDVTDLVLNGKLTVEAVDGGDGTMTLIVTATLANGLTGTETVRVTVTPAPDEGDEEETPGTSGGGGCDAVSGGLISLLAVFALVYRRKR